MKSLYIHYWYIVFVIITVTFLSLISTQTIFNLDYTYWGYRYCREGVGVCDINCSWLTLTNAIHKLNYTVWAFWVESKRLYELWCFSPKKAERCSPGNSIDKWDNKQKLWGFHEFQEWYLTKMGSKSEFVILDTLSMELCKLNKKENSFCIKSIV